MLFFSISQARAAKYGWETGCTCEPGLWQIYCVFIDVDLAFREIPSPDIIATFVLSFVFVCAAVLWDSYFESKMAYPPSCGQAF